jgi:hypothetical protein
MALSVEQEGPLQEQYDIDTFAGVVPQDSDNVDIDYLPATLRKRAELLAPIKDEIEEITQAYYKRAVTAIVLRRTAGLTKKDLRWIDPTRRVTGWHFTQGPLKYTHLIRYIDNGKQAYPYEHTVDITDKSKKWDETEVAKIKVKMGSKKSGKSKVSEVELSTNQPKNLRDFADSTDLKFMVENYLIAKVNNEEKDLKPCADLIRPRLRFILDEDPDLLLTQPSLGFNPVRGEQQSMQLMAHMLTTRDIKWLPLYIGLVLPIWYPFAPWTTIPINSSFNLNSEGKFQRELDTGQLNKLQRFRYSTAPNLDGHTYPKLLQQTLDLIPR